MTIYIIVGIVALIIVYLLICYNSFVKLNNQVKEAFSTMDVYLKKRWDLIPNIVETVKGYAKHEKSTLEEVIKARNTYLSSKTNEDKINSSKEMTEAVNKLFALAEAYPELKANTNFLQLQNELKETEDKISYARQFYNDSVLMYNNKVETFPSNIIANMFGFKTNTFFEATEEERKNVEVKF